MKPEEKLEFELPIAGLAWTREAGHPAGIFLLEGRFHLAALDTPAERHLRESGALHVANLRFDRDPAEQPHPDRPVHPLLPREVVGWVGRPRRN